MKKVKVIVECGKDGKYSAFMGSFCLIIFTI